MEVGTTGAPHRPGACRQKKERSKTARGLLRSLYSRRESNPDRRFRKPLFYPLNYRSNRCLTINSGAKIAKFSVMARRLPSFYDLWLKKRTRLAFPAAENPVPTGHLCLCVAIRSAHRHFCRIGHTLEAKVALQHLGRVDERQQQLWQSLLLLTAYGKDATG